MEEFTAHYFVNIGASLATVDKWMKSSSTIPNYHKDIADIFRDIGKELGKIGCKLTQIQAHQLGNKIQLDKKMKVSELKIRCAVLKDSIFQEMQQQSFFWVPPDRMKYYTEEHLFGELVKERFDTASYDIKECGKCFSMARYTASVLHAMRVLESGLRVLCRDLKVPFREDGWNKILERLSSKWKTIEGRKRKPKNWKKLRQFYSEAFAEFNFIKDAWRNYAMHAHARYDEDKAREILIHSKGFMQTLATRLKE